MPVTVFSEQQFIETYCMHPSRQNFVTTIEDLFGFAHDTDARTVFIGGSFITSKLVPGDVDVLLAYHNDHDIPRLEEYPGISEIEVDMQFSSYEDPKTLDSYLYMFAHDRNGFQRTVAQVNIQAGEQPYRLETPEEAHLKSITDAYVNRHVIRRNAHKGILVSVHGLYSVGEWNVDIAPIASAQGWIFAPYTYTGNNWQLLFSVKKRKATIEHFRHWIYDVCERYKSYTPNLSIVAHSYGTYIVGKYLNGFEELPVDLNAIILTGSVLNRRYNWDIHFEQARIGSVMNIYSPNDSIIGSMPDTDLKKFIFMDKLFGSAGRNGFISEHPRLIQKKLDILNHANSIKRDVIETVWMPFLNNNHNARHVNETQMRARKRKAS